MAEETITVKVKLFAVYQDAYGVDEIKLELPSQTCIADVLEHLLSEKPELQRWRELTRYGLNLQFVESDTLLQDGDEIVFIPPVSGG